MLPADLTLHFGQKIACAKQNGSARTEAGQRGGASEADASRMQRSKSIVAQFRPMSSMLWPMRIHGGSFNSVSAFYALEVFLTLDR